MIGNRGRLETTASPVKPPNVSVLQELIAYLFIGVIG